MWCWIYRWCVACRVDAGTALGPQVAGHVKTCRACRRYYQTHLEVSDLLNTQVPHVKVEDAQAFRDTLLVSLTARDAMPVFRHRPNARFYLTLAASVCILVSVTLTRLHMAAQRRAKMREQTSALASMVTLPRQWAPSQLLANYGPLMQAPLETEVQNLAADAKQTARFLVQCTPFARAEEPIPPR